jgi:hypothetical protein
VEKKRKDKARATVLLPGERGRKEGIDDPSSSSDRSSADSLDPIANNLKSTAQAMNHATRTCVAAHSCSTKKKKKN